MFLILFLLLCIGIIPVQLILFRQKKWYIRVIPTAAILVLLSICGWIAYMPERLSVQGEGQLAAIIAFFSRFLKKFRQKYPVFLILERLF